MYVSVSVFASSCNSTIVHPWWPFLIFLCISYAVNKFIFGNLFLELFLQNCVKTLDI